MTKCVECNGKLVENDPYAICDNRDYEIVWALEARRFDCPNGHTYFLVDTLDIDGDIDAEEYAEMYEELEEEDL